VVKEHEITALPAVDPDIDAILEQALQKDHINSLRDTEAYRLGRVEERVYIANKGLLSAMEKMALPAEIFYSILSTIIPKASIEQYRIGKDPSTGEPVVLSVISKDVEDKVPLIHEIASNLELRLLNERNWDCSFWVIVNRKLAQSLIEQDFPFYRISE
jgi:hypothetical protein